MKVCILTSVHPRNDSRIFVKQARTLAANGYDVTLICADGLPEETADGVHIISVEKTKNRWTRLLTAAKRVYRAALHTKADIYHIHDPELVPCGIKLVKKGFPVLYDIHEDVVETTKEKTWIPSLFRGLAARFVLNNERRAARKLTGVIAATPYLKELYTQYGATDVIDVCNYPFTEHLPLPQCFSERTLDVGYTGVCVTPDRGALQMAQAIAKVEGRLDVFGDVRPESLKKQMQDLASGDKLHFHGRVAFEVLQGKMKNMKIGFLVEHPTKNAINALCIKMFEYMSHGIPIVSSNIRLWEQIIQTEECGICVDPFDVDQIAQAVDYMHKNPEEAEKMGMNGYNAVKSRYSWENEQVKLLSMYKKHRKEAPFDTESQNGDRVER